MSTTVLPWYAPDPGDYRRVALGNGRAAEWTYDAGRIVDGGTRIKQDQGVQMGIGMSNERTPAWQPRPSSGPWRAIQERTRSHINSPETVEAVKYMSQLFKNAMTPEVFGWNAASNNQLSSPVSASYILNSISAYRTAQKANRIRGATSSSHAVGGSSGPGGSAGARARGLHL